MLRKARTLRLRRDLRIAPTPLPAAGEALGGIMRTPSSSEVGGRRLEVGGRGSSASVRRISSSSRSRCRASSDPSTGRRMRA